MTSGEKSKIQVSSRDSAPRLFRETALMHAGDKTYGSVLMVIPLGFRIHISIYLIVFLLLVLFVAQLSYTRKAQVVGVLVPTEGLVRIVPPRRAVVVEVRVTEGQSVEEGEVLFVLNSERFTSTGEIEERAISKLLDGRRDSLAGESAALRELSQQKLESIRLSLITLDDQLHQLDEQIVLQQRRVELAERRYQQFSELHVKEFVPAVQVDDRLAELIEQKQRWSDFRRTRTVKAIELAERRQSLREAEIQGRRDESLVQRNVETVEQELSQRRARHEILLRAPRGGVVTAVSVASGQAIDETHVVASVIPANSKMEAELYVPSRSVGLIRVGSPVTIRYQSFPYQKFGQYSGVVNEVSDSVMRNEDLSVPDASASDSLNREPKFRIKTTIDRQTVTVNGVEHRLRSGMLLHASVQLERRRIYEYFLEPISRLRDSIR